MKIVRVEYQGRTFYGCIEGEEVREFRGSPLGDFEPTEQVVSLKDVSLLTPIEPPNVVAIGLNYRRHAAESGQDVPEHPAVFLKATTSVTGPNSPILLPKEAPDYVDYEAELAVVIGRRAKHVPPEKALEYVLGYTCANDVSARDCQRHLDVQWARGKSFDTFCPLGPWIETEFDPGDAAIRSRLNGRIMQDSRTADMIFSVPFLVSYLSRNMTLLPGTVIITGTPEGVGFARKPPVYLRAGDRIEIEIEGLGRLSNPVACE